MTAEISKNGLLVVKMQGSVFEGPTAEDVVTQMRCSTFDPEPNNAQYMRGLAKRLKAVQGKVVRCRNATRFLHGLHDCGFITLTENKPEG